MEVKKDYRKRLALIREGALEIKKINKSTIQQINDKKSIFAQNQKTGI